MNREDNYDALVKQLRRFLPEDRVLTDELRTLAWGVDASFYHMVPRVVVQPETEKELSQVVKACGELGLPFTFRAAGTALSGQSVSDSVLIVCGKRWEKYAINKDGDSITMQPGLTGGRVNKILQPLGRQLGPDPASINAAMIGGIVANNASGMSCGVHANSDRLLQSVRLVLTDGTVLDTGSEESREAFRKSHGDMLRQIEQLRDDVRRNAALADRIRKKYSIKNVTGLNLRPLIAYDDPFDIIAHSMVGSEGTLAFMSEVTMQTLRIYPFRATAMVYFPTMETAARAVVAMKPLQSDEGDLRLSQERQVVKCAEMLDYLSLKSVDDPVYEQYIKEVDEGEIAAVQKGDYHNLTAVLVETRATTQETLRRNIEAISLVLRDFELYRPLQFTTDAQEQARLWALRSGIFPTVGGLRPVGTSCLIEDVAFPIDVLPEATVRLQQIIASHGYSDGCIYGHALEGNFHFILNQSFDDDREVKRYARMMEDVVALVRHYDGSLKAEHGTGRNMAPFVKEEWGDDAFEAMRRLKDIFDPKHLLNPGVIFNDDPQCFIKHLKQLPRLGLTVTHAPGHRTDPYHLQPLISSETTMMEGVARADKCIECGFCEINCISCGFTLSSRQRIATQREISRLQASGRKEDLARARRLDRLYHYFGDKTCAADGLCSTSCPMKINTADVTHILRQRRVSTSRSAYAVGRVTAQHLRFLMNCLRLTLSVADIAHSVLGTRLMSKLCRGLHKIGIPLWTPAMPRPNRINGIIKSLPKPTSPRSVVYFPSCLNQTMGLAKGAPVKHSVVGEMVELFRKAGYDVIFPPHIHRLCCGQIWESKGMLDTADRKTAELEAALWQASEGGRWPVVCDQSPCLHRMRKMFTRMKLYEPAEFILKFLAPRLQFHQLHRTVAIHITCSMREMGLGPTLLKLAEMCADKVIVPEGVGCCGFAGDRGFFHPELNDYGLRHLRDEIEKHHVERGYSNSRTCEIGLQQHAGVPYMGIAYLVNEATEPLKE